MGVYHWHGLLFVSVQIVRQFRDFVANAIWWLYRGLYILPLRPSLKDGSRVVRHPPPTPCPVALTSNCQLVRSLWLQDEVTLIYSCIIPFFMRSRESPIKKGKVSEQARARWNHTGDRRRRWEGEKQRHWTELLCSIFDDYERETLTGTASARQTCRR